MNKKATPPRTPASAAGISPTEAYKPTDNENAFFNALYGADESQVRSSIVELVVYVQSKRATGSLKIPATAAELTFIRDLASQHGVTLRF